MTCVDSNLPSFGATRELEGEQKVGGFGGSKRVEWSELLFVHQLVDVHSGRRWPCHGDHAAPPRQLIAQQVGEQKGTEMVGREHQLEAPLCLSILARKSGRNVQERVDRKSTR